ncbi:polyprenyl synthetase family protein [Marinilongibacter aquaticus]|uniref:polyprenyl synthetase family protein n=1 Tax=Marinilongibacter aquaticus TaxID=2975157 RepID=UPI0021BDE784|nr:polyprenyl synthetase family protein [Marinilongibacter aquaticus]UBM57449.1 polyprenyl synthetase family protein [Marinilongibacter aquaticus]
MPLKSYLAAIEHALKNHRYGESPIELYEPIHYLMDLGGKRLRPSLVLMAYHLFLDDWQKVLKPALAVEVFHNFTLMHDDIMDEAPLRRGKPTVHEKWNRDVAILSGDVMLVGAYDLLAESECGDFKVILKRFNRTAAEVCEGQQMDMNFSQRQTVDEAEYLEMIRLKTSVLLAFALELGGRLAGQADEIVNQLYAIGINLGLGFQLKDDILDVYGDPEKFGKQVGGDILENKKTWLMIKALEACEDSSLLHWIGQTEFEPEEKIEAVKAIYARYEIKEKAEAKMNEYFERGFSGIDALPVSFSRKQELVDFAKYLYGRER